MRTMKCYACGCTDLYGCPEGCGWWGAELCTVCFQVVLERLDLSARDLLDAIGRDVPPRSGYDFLRRLARLERRAHDQLGIA